MKYCQAALLKIGFQQSQHDECLYYRDGIMIAIYVDDCCCAYRDQQVLDRFVQELKDKHFEFTVDGTLEAFLGIKLERKDDCRFDLTQSGLITKVLETTRMKDCKPVSTPAVKNTLGLDPTGEPHDEEWSYPSVVGMLMYLATNTRPDIAFAVSQVARFNHYPKQSHSIAVKRIIRYLKGTADKGMIVRPTKKLDIDLFCDGDFAGLYRSDPDSTVTSAKSRMGYVILLSGCPLIWRSSLLQEVALSVCEVEYAALSYSLRALIPIRRILQEMISQLNLDTILPDPTIRSNVFEDNAAALQLATSHHLTNRTRYFHTKWHWFWDYVKSYGFQLHKVDTTKNLADIATKGTVGEVFIRLRKMLLGW